MKKNYFFAFFCLFLLKNPLFAQDSVQLRKEIVKLLTYEIGFDTAKITGIGVGVIYGDSVWTYSFGKAEKGTDKMIDGDMLFPLGGVGKLLTATRLEIAKNAKLLNDTLPCNRYLSAEQQFPLGEKITTLQLLTHTSGLPRLPTGQGDNDENNIEQPYFNYSEQQLFDFLRSLSDTIQIGKYDFSHLNYALLEKIADNLTAQQGDIVNNEKYQFLSTTFLNTTNGKPMAQGYNTARKPIKPWLFNETYRGALGYYSSLNRLLGFLQISMGQKESDLLPLLLPTQAGIFETQKDKDTKVGKAWHRVQMNKKTEVCVISGTSAGHGVFMAMLPRTKTAVVAFTNTRAIPVRTGMEILKIINFNWKK